MALTGSTNEQKIWNYLRAAGLNAYGTAGLMGNLFAESGLIPTNLQNTYEKKLGYTDASYTAAVDSGAYTNFAKDSAGYGLAQWTFSTRKANLLAYAKAAGKSVGDLETQLAFLVKELSESYKAVLSTLKTATTVKAASDAVLTQFERPADQSDAVKAKRAGYGQTYYDKYASGGATPAGGTSLTEAELRQKVVDIINAWVGATKGSAKHLEILSIYNSYKPLARGYEVKRTDAYCATTVSAAYIQAGIAAYTGTECGVEKFTIVAKGKGIWVENDAHVPKLGDACVYDWDDSGAGDCTGAADHIGIVTKVGSGTFVVTEGNMTGGVVGTRTMAINGKYIRGFICPDFAAIAKKLGGSTASATPATPTASASISTKHTVVVGDTLSKIAAKFGTTVSALAEINNIANVNLIKVGQVIYLTAAAAATGKLAALGVINSPDYWAEAAASGKVKYLDLLLTKAAEKITKAGTRTATPEEGVAALVAAGVINSPDYWLSVYGSFPSLNQLLCALGGAVK